MAYNGLNLRASNSGFGVVDGTGETYIHDTDSGTVTRGGITFTLGGTSISGNGRNRNISIDRRLAGIIYAANGGAKSNIAITLNDGAGIYDVWLAIGDNDNPFTNQSVVIKDGSGGSTLATIGPASTSAGQNWLDANGVERALANWPTYANGGGSAATGARRLTFSGTSLFLEWGTTSGSSLTCLSHIGWEFVSSGGGSTTRGTPFGHRGTAFNGGRTFNGILQRARQMRDRDTDRRLAALGLQPAF